MMNPLDTNQDATAIGGLAIVSKASGGVRPNVEKVERYEELRELDRGGCGRIVLALDRQLDRQVVLKFMLSVEDSEGELANRFLTEAKITGSLEHPGIVPIYEAGVDLATGCPFYAMKWLRGLTLAEAIKSHWETPPGKARRNSERRLLERFRSVCQTLAYAHEKNIVHRDLKPANVLIGEFGETIVLDWGLAKRLGTEGEGSPNGTSSSPEQESRVMSEPTTPEIRSGKGSVQSFVETNADVEATQAGCILGTLSYMSPEQARGQSQFADKRSDVFALGCILYEMLTGVSPFRAAKADETLERIRNVKYLPATHWNRQVSKPLQAIIAKCLEKDPANRYQDSGALEQDIGAFLAGESVQAYDEPLWRRLDRLASNHRSWVWSLFLLLASTAIAGILAASAIESSRRSTHEALLIAEKEHREKKAALADEQAAHQEAISQLQSARESIDNWLTDLNEDLKRFPELVGLREEIIERAESHYRELAGKSPNLHFTELESARANVRLGELHLSLNQSDSAKSCFENAIRLLEDASASSADDWEDVMKTQLAEARLGLAHSLRRKLQSDPEILHQIELALEIVTKIDRDSAEFSQSQRILMLATQLKAKALFEQGLHSESLGLYVEALGLVEYLDSADGGNDDRQLALALLEDYGQAHRSLNKMEGAIHAYLQQVRIYSTFIEQSPERSDWLRARAQARLQLGKCYAIAWKATEAITQLEAAEEDLMQAEHLTLASHRKQDSRATIRSNLGNAYLLAGEHDRAEKVLHGEVAKLGLSSSSSRHDPLEIEQALQVLAWYGQAIGPRRVADLEKTVRNMEQWLTGISTEIAGRESMSLLTLELERFRVQVLFERGDFEELVSRVEKRDWQEIGQGESQSIGQYLLMGDMCLIAADAYRQLSRLDEAKLMTDRGCRLLEQAERAERAGLSDHATFRLIEHACHHQDLEFALEDTLDRAHRLVSLHPNNALAWHWLAVTQWQLEQGSKAVESLEKAMRLRRHQAIEDELLRVLFCRDGLISETIEADLLEFSNLEVSRRSHARWLSEQLAKSQSN